MKTLAIPVIITLAILSCNAPKTDEQTTNSTSDTTKRDQYLTFKMYKESEAKALLPDSAKTDSKKLEQATRKQAYLVNMNYSWTLLKWQVIGEGEQNMNCPVGHTCDYTDPVQCAKEGKRIQIGTVPCGVTYKVVATFRNQNGEIWLGHISDGYMRCDQPATNFPVYRE